MRRISSLLISLLLPLQLTAASKVIHDFEKDTEGWGGKATIGAQGATSGKSALEIDATGSAGWNQDLAMNAKNGDYTNFNELLLDVTVPEGTMAAAGFIEFSPIFSGKVDSWYVL